MTVIDTFHQMFVSLNNRLLKIFQGPDYLKYSNVIFLCKATGIYDHSFAKRTRYILKMFKAFREENRYTELLTI